MSRVWHIVHNPALQNPRPASIRPVPPNGPHKAPQLFQGPDLWAAWHRRALNWAGGDDAAWVTAQILSRLPCGDCSNHAKAYMAAHPPTFEASTYFGWTVAFHNAVNLRLGRLMWTFEEARQHWSAAPLQAPDSTVATPQPPT